MRVAVIHQAVPDDASADERDVLAQVAAVSDSLVRLGHEPTNLAATLNLERLRDDLARARPDAIFNLVESLDGSDRLIGVAPNLFEVLAIPFTGSSSHVLTLSSHKVLAKRWLADAGLPTADWVELSPDRGDLAAEPREPGGEVAGTRYILKAIGEHASFGMDENCVVAPAGREQLQTLLAEFESRHRRPAFAERYIEGREFNVALLAGPNGPEALPVAEIQFVGYSADRPKIVCYRAKWQEDSYEFSNTPRTFDLPDADRPLVDELARLSLAAWRRFGLRGYARVDFRVDAAGQPWILEVNANPCLSPDAGFAAMLVRAGIAYDDAIARILADALPRRE